MSDVNLIGARSVEGQNIELTKFLIFDYRSSKKQAIPQLLEHQYSLADLGVFDRQALVLSEALTDAGKKVIQRHHAQEFSLGSYDDNLISKDTTMQRSFINYSNQDDFQKTNISTSQVSID